MNRTSVCLPIFIFFTQWSFAQELNFSFENETLSPWYKVGQHENYTIRTDSSIYCAGKKSLLIQNRDEKSSFGGVMLTLPENLRGDSIEISAQIKLENVDNKSKLGFMLRIDSALYFNNFEKENVNGTIDWKEYRIKAKLTP